MFFTCLLKHCHKGCLVVTELRERCSIFPMYTLSVQYAKVAEVCVLIDNIGKGYFLTGHSEKGCQFQDVERTAKSDFVVLCFRIGTLLTSNHPSHWDIFFLFPLKNKGLGYPLEP